MSAAVSGEPRLGTGQMFVCARARSQSAQLRFSTCECGWRGELWDGDQPPLTDSLHVCRTDRSEVSAGG